jgi:hypothetical protein
MPMGGRLAVLLTAVAVAAGLLAAPAAEATFHLIKVREVHPGTTDSYVELQMYASGQGFLGGRSMTVYDAAGALVHSSTFSAGVPNQQNQQTVLIGGSGVQGAFGVAPDLVDSGLSLPAAGGAACWNAGGIPADCVAWGNFSGGAALQSATGTSAGAPASAGGIAAGKAIRRTIAPGCPTLLEESDDSNSSAANFAEVTPAPRNDSSPIVEATCAGAPNTAIDDRPPLNSNSADAEFTYDAPTATSYECKLDAEAFAGCPNAGEEYSGLSEASHTFMVRGVNGSGPDPTPATYTWKVDLTRPTSTIDTHPVDPSPGTSPRFTFHASETALRFECSLAKGAEADAFSVCASGKTYPGLGDGSYAFKLRATDLAGNEQPTPTSFSWQVDNSLADTTPPETTILARPPDPSTSSTATFAYASSEAGSSFQCSLDGAAFGSCPATGITYTELASGPHGFRVRAIDSSANVDPEPAGYSFSVVLPSLAGPVPSPPPPRPLAPETILSGRPAAKTHDRTPGFRFRSDSAGSSFQCAVDRQPLRPCRSPFTTKALGFGRHTFTVRALAGGLADPSPSRFSFKVLRGRG